ncbi:MAG: hypothetical protein ACTSQA_01190 [Candidatus Heimdallarchaeaceae archaeon]
MKKPKRTYWNRNRYTKGHPNCIDLFEGKFKLWSTFEKEENEAFWSNLGIDYEDEILEELEETLEGFELDLAEEFESVDLEALDIDYSKDLEKLDLTNLKGTTTNFNL